jgi:hypothetical protein
LINGCPSPTNYLHIGAKVVAQIEDAVATAPRLFDVADFVLM